MLTSGSQMHSLREVASRINSGVDLPAILFDLVRTACQHGGWSMGSIMSVDVAHGFAHVSVRHDPTLLRIQLEDRWELATSPALVALRTGEPVYIPDARVSEEFPGYRREAFERDYRSVLVMPLTSVDADGRPMVLSLISRESKPLPSDDLAYMGLIAHLGAIAVEREHRLHVVAERDTGLVEVLQPVVALIGQREPGLDEEGDVALGVARVGLDVHADHAADEGQANADDDGVVA